MAPLADLLADVATRIMPGHWESDLFQGARE
jgi:hypothetical protein